MRKCTKPSFFCCEWFEKTKTFIIEKEKFQSFFIKLTKAIALFSFVLLHNKWWGCHGFNYLTIKVKTKVSNSGSNIIIKPFSHDDRQVWMNKMFNWKYIEFSTLLQFLFLITINVFLYYNLQTTVSSWIFDHNLQNYLNLWKESEIPKQQVGSFSIWSFSPS